MKKTTSGTKTRLKFRQIIPMSKRRGEKMPLLEHIREFRDRMLKSVLAIGLGAVAGWILYQPIIRLLTLPFCDLKNSSLPVMTSVETYM